MIFQPPINVLAKARIKTLIFLALQNINIVHAKIIN